MDIIIEELLNAGIKIYGISVLFFLQKKNIIFYNNVTTCDSIINNQSEVNKICSILQVFGNIVEEVSYRDKYHHNIIDLWSVKLEIDQEMLFKFNIYLIKNNIKYINPIYSLNYVIKKYGKYYTMYNLFNSVDVNEEDITNLRFVMTSLHQQILYKKEKNKIEILDYISEYDTDYNRINLPEKRKVVSLGDIIINMDYDNFVEIIRKDIYIPIDISIKGVNSDKLLLKNNMSKNVRKKNDNKNIKDDLKNKEYVCVICLEEIKNSKIYMTECNHILHSTCLHEYIVYYYEAVCKSLLSQQNNSATNVNNSCPVCKSDAFSLKNIRLDKDDTSRVIFNLDKKFPIKI